MQETTVILTSGTGALEIVNAPEGEGVSGDSGEVTLATANDGTVALSLDDLDARCDEERSDCRVIAHQNCEDMDVEVVRGEYRGAITRVWGISCEEAHAFAQVALANDCNVFPFSCSSGGYRCRETGGEGGGQRPGHVPRTSEANRDHLVHRLI